MCYKICKRENFTTYGLYVKQLRENLTMHNLKIVDSVCKQKIFARITINYFTTKNNYMSKNISELQYLVKEESQATLLKDLNPKV